MAASSFHVPRICRRNRPRFHCKYCDHIAFGEDLLKTHVAKSHDRQVYVCPMELCPFTCSCKDELRVHYLKLHKKTYECTDNNCRFATAYYHSLIRHQKSGVHVKRVPDSHICEPLFKCSSKNCTFSSTYLTSVQRHFRNAHTLNRPVFPCFLCKIYFKTEGAFRNHQQKCHHVSQNDCK